MEHKLIVVGLSSDPNLMRKEVIRQIGKLARSIAPQINDKNINVISNAHPNAAICSEIMRQIFKSMNKMDMYNDLGSENMIPYFENSEEILSHESSKDFILKQIENFEILIVVCQDTKRWEPNPIKVLSGLDFPGLPIKAQTLDLQPFYY